MFAELGIAVGKIVEARRNARLGPEDFRQARLERFRKLARHANAHSPWYADIIRERSINVETCTPADFPLLTKTILMQNFDRIVTDRRITRQAVSDVLDRSKDPAEKFLGEFRVMHTSGTSGEVGYFLYSNQDWMRGLFGGAFRRRRRPPRRKRSHGGR
jgi:phenylacetate-coenzyme A ligase PaaK-like adenylate-forming protein